MKIVNIIIVGLLLLSCKKEVGFEKNYAFSIEYKLDGELYVFDKHDDATASNPARFGAYNGTSTSSFFQFLEFRSTFSEHIIGGADIRFSYRRSGDSLLLDSAYRRYRNYNDFKAIFSIGEHSFADAWNQEGISISYIKNGELWVSERVYWNNQPIPTHSSFYNSSFEISAVEKFYYEKQAEDAVRVFASFEATLYNETGDSLRIDDGSFEMLFSQGDN